MIKSLNSVLNLKSFLIGKYVIVWVDLADAINAATADMKAALSSAVLLGLSSLQDRSILGPQR